VEQSIGRPCRQCDGRSKRPNDLTSSIVPRGTSFHHWVELDFLLLHLILPQIAAMDLFVVPTIGFNLLYVLVIVRLARRELVWINVTAYPTADWIARQITEAFPWNAVPRYLIRDRDGIYGVAVTRRLRAMGIRDKPVAAGSPWQNSFAERLIGTIRRECVDHIVVLGETHLRRILREYAGYYNTARTHRSLDQDAPVSRPVQQIGRIVSHACHNGLYSRCAHPTVGQPARQAQSAYATHPRVAAPNAPSSADTTTITAPTCCQRVSVSQKYLTSIGLPSQ
jgi:hypothetical protein